ncbi:MAG: RidA family protein [bacterium]
MRQQIHPENFYKSNRAYSPGLKVDIGDSEMIFVAGQIAKDKDGNVIAPNDITEQTEFVFQKIEKILDVAGASMEDVVKAVIYVTNMSDLEKISAVRNKYFANCKPVSTLIEINKTTTEGCNVEIEAIAIRKK